MKPNIKFLRKVRDGKVYRYKHYTMKRGGYTGFVGGEATASKHADAGFVEAPARGASLGCPAVYTLTEKGKAALAEAGNE